MHFHLNIVQTKINYFITKHFFYIILI